MIQEKEIPNSNIFETRDMENGRTCKYVRTIYTLFDDIFSIINIPRGAF